MEQEENKMADTKTMYDLGNGWFVSKKEAHEAWEYESSLYIEEFEDEYENDSENQKNNERS